MKILYGYCLNHKNEIAIDPAKAEAVVMIYDMYIEGSSLRKISQKLSEKGYLSPSGKSLWSAQAINNIIPIPNISGSFPWRNLSRRALYKREDENFNKILFSCVDSCDIIIILHCIGEKPENG